VEIADTGPGLSPQELERVFEPFERGASGASSPTGAAGSGLGLTIAKMLTDLMGGELSVRSAPGQGAVFQVRLFLPELHAPYEGADYGAPPRRPRRAYAGVRRRILVVDNEEADRDLLLNLLQPLGFELRTAASGYDCLDLLAAGWQPDALLLDLAMPGIDGWETLRRVRALGAPEPAVAIVSANAFDRALEHALGVAPEDFIVKPVRHSELLDWLERRLALQWLEHAPLPAAAPEPVQAPPNPGVAPQRAELEALQALLGLGYFRGAMNALQALEQAHPGSAAFVAALRAQVRAYRFEAAQAALQKVLDEPA